MSPRKALFVALLMLMAVDCNAQRRRRNTTPPPPTPEELAEMARKEKFERKLQVMERVTFIDSLLLKKSEVMDMVMLGEECGRVQSLASFQNTAPDGSKGECTLFRSQLGDKIIFAEPGTDGRLHLYASEKIGDDWSEKAVLQGLNDTVSNNYPFMMTDGATFYYASKDEDGLGGYDIYMTRWDSDEKRFLKPENIGMPFNSEANDYLYMVDEFNNLGWFVTDRGLSGDSVCMYCFIPNESRRIYNANSIGHDTLVALANINSIRDTWEDKVKVNEALDRLAKLKNKASKSSVANFRFIINDNIIYTSLAQFRTKESRDLATKWMAMSKHLQETTAELDRMRLEYRRAAQQRKAELAPAIKAMEEKYADLRSEIYATEKEIRNFEQR